LSATVVVPPPNSSSLLGRAPRLTARARAMLTAMNLHFAGVAALGVVVLYLAVHLFLLWNSLEENNATALDNERVQMIKAELAAEPLRGLDAKVAKSSEQADQFYVDRLPYATSQVAAELGRLTHANNVHLARVQYAYAPVLSGKDQLIEVRMDAGVSGDYRNSMEFINALERDKMFFLISSINLSGQQTGQVNLRIRLNTFLREPLSDEQAKELADARAADAAAQAPAGGAQ
jgi:type IV pilus assembly protein PilO